MTSNITEFLSKDQPIFTNGIFNSREKARQEPLTRRPFFELIEKKNDKKVPYILGVTPDCFNSEMDGVLLHKSFNAHGVNPYTGKKIEDVYFYTINKDEEELTYLGKISDKDHAKRTFLDTYIDANDGNPVSQAKLGDFYRIGQGVQKNLNEALKYYEIAGDDSKMGKLALEMGDSFYNKKDYPNAVKYYTIALKIGHEISNTKLMAIYSLLGDFNLESPSDAKRYYQLAAGVGCPESKLKLALILEQGWELFVKNPMKSIEAQLKFGDVLLKHGNNVEALQCYQRVANTGNAEGISKFGDLALELGDLYYHKKDPANTVKYYTMALNSGHKISKSKLGAIYTLFGNFYWSGTHFEKNSLKSIEYYKLGAEQDQSQALIKMADYSIKEQNIKEAIRLINRFVDLKLGENCSQLQPWISQMRSVVPHNEPLQIALSRLYVQCSKRQKMEGTGKVLNEITNKPQAVNQNPFYGKRLNQDKYESKVS